ncbi:unnamed protein product [Meloidogyne enterolobii]|uniref:Uncharacterized protein n=1 Tax=Meloidogyne enterolobii TaxID=390850 RepID=A0ACB1AMR1_MELEN
MKKYFIFSLFLYLLIPSSFGTKLAHLLNIDQEEITLKILDEEIAKIMEEDARENLKNKKGKSEIEEIKEDEDFEVKEEENASSSSSLINQEEEEKIKSLEILKNSEDENNFPCKNVLEPFRKFKNEFYVYLKDAIPNKMPILVEVERAYFLDKLLREFLTRGFDEGSDGLKIIFRKIDEIIDYFGQQMENITRYSSKNRRLVCRFSILIGMDLEGSICWP